VISTFNKNYDAAAIAIGVGVVLDGLDGRIARMDAHLQRVRRSIGFDCRRPDLRTLAAAVLALSWGQTQVPSLHLHQMSWIVTFIFLICGAWRLARFNVQTQKPLDYRSETEFHRACRFLQAPVCWHPSCTSSRRHWNKRHLQSAGTCWCCSPGSSWPAPFRYPSFKELHFLKRGSRLTLVATATLIGAIYFYSEITLLVISVVYVSSGLVMRTMRRFSPPVTALGDPAHGNIKT
jgi:CDP-diacylglycerol--serine O-phosphatidyltransferase